MHEHWLKAASWAYPCSTEEAKNIVTSGKIGDVWCYYVGQMVEGWEGTTQRLGALECDVRKVYAVDMGIVKDVMYTHGHPNIPSMPDYLVIGRTSSGMALIPIEAKLQSSERAQVQPRVTEHLLVEMLQFPELHDLAESLQVFDIVRGYLIVPDDLHNYYTSSDQVMTLPLATGDTRYVLDRLMAHLHQDFLHIIGQWTYKDWWYIRSVGALFTQALVDIANGTEYPIGSLVEELYMAIRDWRFCENEKQLVAMAQKIRSYWLSLFGSACTMPRFMRCTDVRRIAWERGIDYENVDDNPTQAQILWRAEWQNILSLVRVAPVNISFGTYLAFKRPDQARQLLDLCYH